MGTTSTTTKQTLLLVGAGPIGLAAAKAASVDGVATPFGVVDPRRDARRLARETLSCVTYQSMDELNGEGPDVALVSFSSKSEITVPTIERLVSRGCHVVTTCEELACPSDSVRSHLSAACRESGASIGRRDGCEPRVRHGPVRHNGCARRSKCECNQGTTETGYANPPRSPCRQDRLRIARRRLHDSGCRRTTRPRRPPRERKTCR